MIPIERTHEYRGLYHVLGGALSPIDGVDADDLKIAELLSRRRARWDERGRLATNPTTTGEATALHIAEALRDKVDGDPPRQRPAGRRRPRACRRGDARQGAGRSAQPRLVRKLDSVLDDRRAANSGFLRRRRPPLSQRSGRGGASGQSTAAGTRVHSGGTARPRGLIAAGDASRQAASGDAGCRRRHLRQRRPASAEAFGTVTAAAVEPVAEPAVPVAPPPPARPSVRPEPAPPPPAAPNPETHPSLYRPGHMRRRLDQMLEMHRRYGHPFCLAVFDVAGPGPATATAARRRR